MFDFGGSLTGLMETRNWKSRAINAENPTGEKGCAAMSSSDLGPCRKDVAAGDT